MIIKRKKRFIKSYEKLNRKIQDKFDIVFNIFVNNPFDEILRNHALFGDYKGLRSIDITGDFRAVFKEYPDGTYEFVDFIDIGTHSQLYG